MVFIPNTIDGKWHGTQRLKIHAPWFDTDEQIANFHASLQASGNHSGGAHIRTHGRTSLDGTEELKESAWTEEECTRGYWVIRLAEDTGKSEVAINAQLEHEVMGEGLSIIEGNKIVQQYINDNLTEYEEVF